jgi:hypothetical protein
MCKSINWFFSRRIKNESTCKYHRYHNKAHFHMVKVGNLGINYRSDAYYCQWWLEFTESIYSWVFLVSWELSEFVYSYVPIECREGKCEDVKRSIQLVMYDCIKMFWKSIKVMQIVVGSSHIEGGLNMRLVLQALWKTKILTYQLVLPVLKRFFPTTRAHYHKLP